MTIDNLGKLIHLKKLCTDAAHFQMLAVDQRPPIFNIISRAKGREHQYEEVVECKKLITSSLSNTLLQFLMDPNFSLSNLLQYNNQKALLSRLRTTALKRLKRGRFSENIQNWSVEKIKRVGGDAVKVLAWYRPDAETESIEHQKQYVKKIGEECEKYGIPFLLELLVYPFQR